MMIDTGSKPFWIGAFFALLIADAILKILVGLGRVEKSTHYNLATTLDGTILLIISVGWWFGS